MASQRANEPVPVRERWKIVQWVVFENGSIPEVANRVERSLRAIYKYVLSDHERRRNDGNRKCKRRRIIEDDAFAITYLKHTMIGKADTSGQHTVNLNTIYCQTISNIDPISVIIYVKICTTNCLHALKSDNNLSEGVKI